MGFQKENPNWGRGPPILTHIQLCQPRFVARLETYFLKWKIRTRGPHKPANKHNSALQIYPQDFKKAFSHMGMNLK